MVERSPNGIIVVDRNQIVEIVNPTTKALLPLIHDPIGKPLKDVFPVPPLSVEKNFEGEGVQCRFVHGSRTLFLGVFPYQNKSGLIEDVTAQAKSEQYRRDLLQMFPMN